MKPKNREKLELCKSLQEKGLYVRALIELTRLSLQFQQDQDVALALTKVRRKAIEKYDHTRNELIRIVQSTTSFAELYTALNLLRSFGDFHLLKSCESLPIKVDSNEFLYSYADCIGEVLCSCFFGNGCNFIGEGSIEEAKVFIGVDAGQFLNVFRNPEFVQTPIFQCGRCVILDTSVWAASHDPSTEQFIVTLKNEDKVLGINSTTLLINKELKSPLKGIRGIGTIPGLRRGFFNSEYGNKMFSFDLDSFKIRKEISGFSERPERIRIDPSKKLLVTGNLGLKPLAVLAHDIFKNSVSTSEKVTDGQSITIVDAEKEKVVNTVTAGRRPTAVNISRKYIAAGNFWDNTVTIYNRTDLSEFFNVQLNFVKGIPCNFTLHDQLLNKNVNLSQTLKPRLIEGIAILDNRGWILVSGYAACLISIIDIGKQEVIKLIPVQDIPFDIVVDRAEKYAYVSCHASNQVSVVDLDLQKEVYRLATGPNPVDPYLYDEILLVPHSKGMDIFDLKESKKLYQEAISEKKHKYFPQMNTA